VMLSHSCLPRPRPEAVVAVYRRLRLPWPTSTPMTQRNTVFVSYSRRDARWLKRLQVYLQPYEDRGVLTLWDDTRIGPGDEWRKAIRSAIDRAAASVLLVSADFLASKVVMTDELPPLLRRAEDGGAKIWSLFVGPVPLAHHPQLARYEGLNSPSEPLSILKKPRADQVLAHVAERVKEALDEFKIPPPPPPGETSEVLYEQLRSAVVGLSILAALARTHPRSDDFTLTELVKTLDISSRKTAHEVVERMADSGWIEKRKLPGRTSYRISVEGLEQLKRLAEATDGPFRQALPHR